MRISLCMIVKDEEAFLDNCLKSAKPYFDDIVVVDTGSKDRTKEIAQEYGARIFHFEWCDDFSAARNFAANQALHDWIFFIDADETIEEFDAEQLEKIIKQSSFRGVLREFEVSHKQYSYLTRLYNKKEDHLQGKIHEQIVSLQAIDTHKNRIDIPVLLYHYGYEPNVAASKQKFERNERLLLRELAEAPNDPYLLYQLGKSHIARGNEKEACDYFEKALAQSPPAKYEYVTELIECYGYSLINSGQYQKALQFGQDYLPHYQNHIQYRFLMGNICLNNELYIEAVEWFESCVGEKECRYVGMNSFLSYYNIGVILECVGMTEDAIEVYEKCGDYELAVRQLKALQN